MRLDNVGKPSLVSVINKGTAKMNAIITTWIAGDYTKGTSSLRYVYATLVNGVLKCSPHYSTVNGARRAAKRRGLSLMAGVAQGHAEAERRLATLLRSLSALREMHGR